MYDVAHKAINIDSPKQRKPAYPIMDKLAFSVLNKHLINYKTMCYTTVFKITQ